MQRRKKKINLVIIVIHAEVMATLQKKSIALIVTEQENRLSQFHSLNNLCYKTWRTLVPRHVFCIKIIL